MPQDHRRPAVENLPGGPVNVDLEDKLTIPDKSATYRSIEGLIQHFELFMWNRRWETPVEEVYGAHETANGELGFYVVADGSGRPSGHGRGRRRSSTSRSSRC